MFGCMRDLAVELYWLIDDKYEYYCVGVEG